MANGTLMVDLGTDATDADLTEQMRVMKTGRESGVYSRVVCTVRGYGRDRRELADIPEVRRFCRRLVALGFISYLDYSTLLDPRQPAENKGAWGAAEVWMVANDLMRGGQIRVTSKLLDDIEAAVRESNGVADAALGPMAAPPDRS